MTISMPDSARTLIEDQAAKAGFASPAEYLLSLVERERNRGILQEVEDELAKADAEPSSPMTAEDWEEVRRRGTQRVNARKGR